MAEEIAPSPLDQAREAAAEAHQEANTFEGTLDGLHEAADELTRRRAEAAVAEPSTERVERAERGLREAWATALGDSTAADRIDPSQVTLLRDGPLSPREAAAMLGNYRSANQEILHTLLAAETPVEEPPAADTAATDQAAATEAQQRAAAAEAQRQQQLAFQEQQLRLETERQRSQAEQQLALRQQQILQLAVNEAPELITINELARHDPARAQQELQALAQRDPAKFAKLQQLDAPYANDAALLNYAATMRQQEQAQNFRQYAESEDKRLEVLRPELADRKVLREAQDVTLAYLKEAQGLSEDRLRELWYTSREFRSAEAQAMIYDAARGWRAQQSVRDLNSHRRSIPPVQRPGVGQIRTDDTDLGRRFAKSHSARDAAEMLVAARRSAARRSR